MLVRHQGSSLVVFAPAKLNLFLEVLGRRPDGYHQLETVMVSVGLYDTLRFAADDSSQTRLRCRSLNASSPSSGDLPADQRNLIVRAAELLRDETGCRRGATIDLLKRIPLQAGLGGGSSDAAATLLALNRLWNLGLDRAELHRMAARLGSDVNFFLDAAPAALCRGRGEVVSPLRVPRRMHFVVASPPEGLSTAEVFRAWAGGDAPRSCEPTCRFLKTGRAPAGQKPLYNALEGSAAQLNEHVPRTLEHLRRAGCRAVALSGSGSACYGVCGSVRAARSVAARLRQQTTGWVRAVDSRM